MFIKSFGVKNFKCHRQTSVSLFPITVFVGGNGGGKSALFDAIVNFSMLSRGELGSVLEDGITAIGGRPPAQAFFHPPRLTL